ncbi:hypothetical protein GCM10020254_11820 [Streptomyces goshikiensis]
MPGKPEKGPSAATSARLTRHSKAPVPADSGQAAISRVTPPPFFQTAAARSAARRTLTSLPLVIALILPSARRTRWGFPPP